ncbi:MAG TPA: tryptophan 2,3-dioxygenase [Cytophagales bacterium]|nr:tryptophan 2,3-dioxygenase [Cytophagales bacterium]
MSDTARDQRLTDLLEKLQQKYTAMGQDMPSYLDGLLYADYLTYWDYIHLDTLLSLQNPKTSFPDEKVFIIYHQITELYFNLVLSELEQICHHPQLTDSFFVARLDRVIRYFQHLESSFEIMIVGMEREQFLKFRMSLLPASGFQSGQYRMIEFCSTDVINLVNVYDRPGLTEYSDIDQQLEKLYWRSGATELATGAKTLTLKQFEKKYMGQFRELTLRYRDCNLLSLYQRRFAGHEAITQRLREFDLLANVYWPLAHLKSAGHYLQRDPEDIKATGGTNWQKYLPPRFQKIMFFPELWTEQEKEEWGKPGVLKNLKLTS